MKNYPATLTRRAIHALLIFGALFGLSLSPATNGRPAATEGHAGESTALPSVVYAWTGGSSRPHALATQTGSEKASSAPQRLRHPTAHTATPPPDRFSAVIGAVRRFSHTDTKLFLFSAIYASRPKGRAPPLNA